MTFQRCGGGYFVANKRLVILSVTKVKYPKDSLSHVQALRHEIARDSPLLPHTRKFYRVHRTFHNVRSNQVALLSGRSPTEGRQGCLDKRQHQSTN